MFNLEILVDGELRDDTGKAMPRAGAPHQFAHGGNGMAPQNPAANDAASDFDRRDMPVGDNLVMLQLASFEGRAV